MTSSDPVQGTAHTAGAGRVRRVGIMGGSFDPVHVGHVALAESALEHLRLDEVRWIPVGVPWQKRRKLADASHRLAMVHAATAHEPRFVVDALEVDRAGPSYTVDTFRSLRDAASIPTEWFLIIGQDQYANLPTWQGWQELVQGLTLAVARRGHDVPRAAPEMSAMAHHALEIPLPPLHVSSSAIRAELSAGKDPLTLAPRWLAPHVARYIAEHQLYAPGASH